MKFKSSFARKLSLFAGAIMASALVPFSGLADEHVEEIGNLKWTYSVEGKSARIDNVKAQQDERIKGVVEVPTSFGGFLTWHSGTART